MKMSMSKIVWMFFGIREQIQIEIFIQIRDHLHAGHVSINLFEIDVQNTANNMLTAEIVAQ